jgi:hypothetical protein
MFDTDDPQSPAGAALAAVCDAERATARAHAAQLRAIAEFDRCWAGTDLAEFAADELSLALRISPAAARDRLHLARTMTGRLTATLEALTAGQIDLYKARAIAEATGRLDDDAAALAVEARVLPRAPEQTGAQLKAALRRAVLSLDPRGSQRRHARAVADRRVELIPLDDGIADLWLRNLPADHAVAIHTMLDGLARAAYVDDGETRTLDQLRADALAEIAYGVLDGAGWAGRPGWGRWRGRARGHTPFPASTLLGLTDEPGWLEGYGPVPSSVARRIAADATWRRLLTDPLTGSLVDYGTTSYTPGVVLDQYVTTRDQTCRFPTCTRPASGCDIDHTVPYPARATVECNLGCLCRRHHRAKHAGYRLVQDRPGHFTWTTPTGRTHAVSPPPLATPRAVPPVRSRPARRPPTSSTTPTQPPIKRRQ